MSEIDNYLKLAKNIMIKPEKEDIDEKIIDRIENLSEEDKKLLDDKFMEYLRKNNSRLYLFTEDIKNNPGKLVILILLFLAIFGVSIFIFRIFSLPSSNNKKKDN